MNQSLIFFDCLEEGPPKAGAELFLGEDVLLKGFPLFSCKGEPSDVLLDIRLIGLTSQELFPSRALR